MQFHGDMVWDMGCSTSVYTNAMRIFPGDKLMREYLDDTIVWWNLPKVQVGTYFGGQRSLRITTNFHTTLMPCGTLRFDCHAAVHVQAS